MRNPQVFLDPEIVWASEETRVYDEGCLSIPEYLRRGRAARQGAGEVPRPRRRGAGDRGGGLLATCIQHEIDHLNGVLFIDHLSKLKRDRVIKKFAKAAKRDAA